MARALIAAAFCASLTALPAAQGSATQTLHSGPETFTAFAVNISNTAPRATATSVDIHVDRYSSDADRDRLLSVLKERGQDALLSELQKLPVVGYIRTPESLRYDLHFARQVAQPEGGRKVILLTDRYMTMWEAVNRPRSADYPFTLIQLQLDRGDRGVGKASIATKITQTDDNTIELEDFANQPVALNDVKKVK